MSTLVIGHNVHAHDNIHYTIPQQESDRGQIEVHPSQHRTERQDVSIRKARDAQIHWAAMEQKQRALFLNMSESTPEFATKYTPMLTATDSLKMNRGA